MTARHLFAGLVLLLALPAFSQSAEKVVFNPKDTTAGHYLAVRPRGEAIGGALVLLSGFTPPEGLLTETKLHNVAYANDLLTVVVATPKLYADAPAVERINAVLAHVAATYRVDTGRFVLVGYDYAGAVALRYTEMTRELPARFAVRPRAVIAVDSPVDVLELWQWSNRQVARNSHYAPEGKYILDLMTREHGVADEKREAYQKLTPVYLAEAGPGNERYLKDVPVRLYYDVDPEWYLKERRSSLYDTHLPGGTELIRRLLDAGNEHAELVTAKKPGVGSNGVRNPNSLSIVDEVECIHWIKGRLGIFDPHTWVPPYRLPTPEGWEVERFPIPIGFAPQIPYRGVEDVRFAPGWDDEKSPQYWSYAFLWWLEDDPKIDAATLERHLTAYYEGLVGRNITGRNIPAAKVVATRVQLKSTRADPGDVATYGGTVTMLDYMAGRPVTLHCRVGVRRCAVQGRTAVFFELSPQPAGHAVWNDLERLKKGFDCGE
jgi:pimeloyl-ACP methyl ester carboxylesterase